MTQYMLIAVAVLSLLLVGAGYALKLSYAENGGLKVALEQQSLIYEKAVADQKETIVSLETQRMVDQENTLALGERIVKIEEEKNAITKSYDKWRTTLKERTLKKPEVTRRAARRAIRNRMCRFYKITGGNDKKCPA